MRTIPLGRTDQEVSVFALGTMTFGTSSSRETCFQLLDAYVERGGNLIDTANMYAYWLSPDPAARGGQSERVIGEWLKERGARRRVLITSKVGNHTSLAERERGACLRASYIVEECEGSLRRLGTDTIDLYYAHVEDRSVALEETMEAFERLRRQGKVRFVGASSWRVWRIERARALCEAAGWASFCCIQNQFSYIQPYFPQAGLRKFPRADDEVRDFCKANGLTIFGWEPLCRGSYFDRTRLDAGKFDHRCVDNLKRLDVLERVASDIGARPAQVVLAWMLHGDPPVHPVVAADTVEQLREDLDAADLSLTADVMSRLDSAPRIAN